MPQARQTENTGTQIPFIPTYLWAEISHQERKAEKSTGYTPLSTLLGKQGCNSERSGLTSLLQALEIFAPWERQAVRTQSSESLLGGMILFGTGVAKFKPEGTVENSGNFGGKQLRRLVAL